MSGTGSTQRLGRRALTGVAVLAIAATGAAWSGCGDDDEDEAQQAIDEAQEQVDEATEEAQQEVEHATEEAEQQAEEAQQEAEEALDEAQQDAEDDGSDGGGGYGSGG